MVEERAQRASRNHLRNGAHGYGLVTMMKVPGADDIQIYEPRHTVAHSL